MAGLDRTDFSACCSTAASSENITRKVGVPGTNMVGLTIPFSKLNVRIVNKNELPVVLMAFIL